MKRSSFHEKPLRWLLLAITLITVGGASLLAQPWASNAGERERRFYWARLYWQYAADALTATCAAGPLSSRDAGAYAPAGEWVLLGCAALGGVAYACAMACALKRVGFYPLTRPVRQTLLGCAVLAGAALTAGWMMPRGPTWKAWQPAAALTALGWTQTMPLPSADPGADAAVAVEDPANAWLLALSLLAAAGPVTLGALAERAARGRALLSFALLISWLALVAGTITLAEGPRGRGPSQTTAAPAPQRMMLGLRDALLAAGSGVCVANEQPPRELTMLSRSATVLVGGLPGALTGGIGLPLVLLGCWGLLRKLWGRTVPTRESAPTLTQAALMLSAAYFGLTLIAALGLLVIEQLVASGYQSPPTLADALFDASSAVGGAAQTSGLSAAVTDANLSSGMYQNADLYVYGVSWLMAMTLLGRVLGLCVLLRCAGGRSEPGRTHAPPPSA